MFYGKGGGRDDNRGKSWCGVGDGPCCNGGGPTVEGVTASVARAEAVAVTAAGAVQCGRRLAGQHLLGFLHCGCEVAPHSIVLAFLEFCTKGRREKEIIPVDGNVHNGHNGHHDCNGHHGGHCNNGGHHDGRHDGHYGQYQKSDGHYWPL